jgi:hypothetical protein
MKYLVALLTLLAALPLQAATIRQRVVGTVYWIAPASQGGNDSNDGLTVNTPKASFTQFFKNPPVLAAGARLILKDGIYNTDVSINCSTPTGNNGTSAGPITIIALHERQAKIAGTGTNHIVALTNCSYYVLDGLQVTGQDGTNGDWSNVLFDNGSATMGVGNVLRRSVIDHSIRYSDNSGDANSGMARAFYNTRFLMEENEEYYFANRGIQLYHSDNAILRRNYFNTNGYNTRPNGTGNTLGDEILDVYPASLTLAENNFVESGGIGYQENASAAFGTNGNRAIANAMLATSKCVGATSRAGDLADMPVSPYYRDIACIHPTGGAQGYANWMQANKNGVFDHWSIFSDNAAGLEGFHYQTFELGDGAPTFTFSNSFIKGTGSGNGFFIENPANASLTSFVAQVTNFWSNGDTTQFSPASNVSSGITTITYTNKATTDPGMGTCYLWVPDGAAAKGQATDGGDIGATILYQTIDGITYKNAAHRLWNATTGAPLFAGATVAGLNDVAGSSLFDIASRLNINSGGCSFPSGY